VRKGATPVDVGTFGSLNFLVGTAIVSRCSHPGDDQRYAHGRYEEHDDREPAESRHVGICHDSEQDFDRDERQRNDDAMVLRQTKSRIQPEMFSGVHRNEKTHDHEGASMSRSDIR